jgi:hypothetical protein
MCDLIGLCRREAGTEDDMRRRGIGMRRSSRRVILICEECGERLVLGGPEEVWLSTRTRFECGCGEEVSLATRLEHPIPAEHYKSQK